MDQTYRKGQVGLLLLVVMGVVIAMVLSIASRSLSDTVLSRQEKESSQAFALAETGVENALSSLSVNPASLGETTLGDLKYKIANSTSYEMYIRELESAYLEMNGADTLIVRWVKRNDVKEDVSTCNDVSGGSPAAIEITTFTTSGAVMRNYYNSYNCPLGTTNGFADSALDGDATYRSTITYNAPANTDFVRIRPIYAGATLAVSGSGAGFGTQQYTIVSQATGGDAQKEIQVNRGLDAPASIFDFAVFTAGTIVK